jgi:hypothetical protein
LYNNYKKLKKWKEEVFDQRIQDAKKERYDNYQKQVKDKQIEQRKDDSSELGFYAELFSKDAISPKRFQTVRRQTCRESKINLHFEKDATPTELSPQKQKTLA